MEKKGILLVNLGTPDSPSTSDVRKYLDEFLMDPRVIDIQAALRTFLVKAVIVPFRAPKSAKLYSVIWDKENGSPLKHYSMLQRDALRKKLGPGYIVELAMRYQSPSIEEALEKLQAQKVNEIKVIPMFPQYASASTGSVYEKIMSIVKNWWTVPTLSFVSSFYDNSKMIAAFASNALKHEPHGYDHVLFSFHGLPERQLIKSDHSGRECLQYKSCCLQINENNKFCYSAQSHHTAKLIARELNISEDKYTVCFQSRLGKTPWVRPYTIDIIHELASKGVRKILVLCPAFVADCLETIYEVSEEYAIEFKNLGGIHMQLVESLNDHPLFIEALAEMSQ
jgi:ferrochelatase